MQPGHFTSASGLAHLRPLEGEKPLREVQPGLHEIHAPESPALSLALGSHVCLPILREYEENLSCFAFLNERVKRMYLHGGIAVKHVNGL